MPRTRSTVTGSLVKDTNHYQVHGGGVVTADYLTYSGERTIKEIADEVTPGYRSILSCGGFLPLNPVRIETTRETRIPGSGGYFRTGTDEYSSGLYYEEVPFGLVVPPADPYMQDQVLQDALARVRAPDWDILTFAAEIKQTHKLIVNTAKRVGSFANDIAKNAWKYSNTVRNAPRSFGDVYQRFSDMWLEARYGWRPLIYDAEDALHALNHTRKKGSTLKGTASHVETINLTHADLGVPVSPYESMSTTEYVTGTRTYRSAAYASPLWDGGGQFGLNVVQTAWELVPYSFVIDWFVDVGGWLQSSMPRFGVRDLGQQLSIKEELNYEVIRNYNWDLTSLYTGSLIGIRRQKEFKGYYRSRAAPPTFPRVNPRITTPKLIDMTLLGVQLKDRVLQTLAKKR